MLKGEICFEGKTMDDLLLAGNEALRRIARGNVCGKDENGESNFTFEVSGEEEAALEG